MMDIMIARTQSSRRDSEKMTPKVNMRPEK